MVEGARRSENLTRPLRRVRTGQKNGRRSGVPSARGIVLTFFFLITCQGDPWKPVCFHPHPQVEVPASCSFSWPLRAPVHSLRVVQFSGWASSGGAAPGIEQFQNLVWTTENNTKQAFLRNTPIWCEKLTKLRNRENIAQRNCYFNYSYGFIDSKFCLHSKASI